MVRGYEDQNLINIDTEAVIFYQLVIIAIVVAIYLSAYILLKYFSKVRTRKDVDLWSLIGIREESSSQILPLCAWSILLLEFVKRLYFSDWSFPLMLTYSFGSRFNRPWASAGNNVGDEKFVFALVGILLPLAGLILSADVMSENKLRRKFFPVLGYLVVLLLVIGAGSRTPAVMLIILPLIYFLKKTRSAFKRGLAITLVACMIATTTSLMYNSRTEGLLLSGQSAGKVVYHQDDSYYRAIKTMDVVSNTYERWELVPFVGASLLNFIPRVIWPEKPTLTKEYWGSFKLDYVTITFVAELSALFGIMGGALASIFVGTVGFFFMVSLYRRIHSSYDLLLYILGILYVYMVFRSLLNVTQFMYMLFFFSIVLRIDKNIMYFKRKKLLRSFVK